MSDRIQKILERQKQRELQMKQKEEDQKKKIEEEKKKRLAEASKTLNKDQSKPTIDQIQGHAEEIEKQEKQFLATAKQKTSVSSRTGEYISTVQNSAQFVLKNQPTDLPSAFSSLEERKDTLKDEHSEKEAKERGEREERMKSQIEQDLQKFLEKEKRANQNYNPTANTNRFLALTKQREEEKMLLKQKQEQYAKLEQLRPKFVGSLATNSFVPEQQRYERHAARERQHKVFEDWLHSYQKLHPNTVHPQDLPNNVPCHIKSEDEKNTNKNNKNEDEDNKNEDENNKNEDKNEDENNKNEDKNEDENNKNEDENNKNEDEDNKNEDKNNKNEDENNKNEDENNKNEDEDNKNEDENNTNNKKVLSQDESEDMKNKKSDNLEEKTPEVTNEQTENNQSFTLELAPDISILEFCPDEILIEIFSYLKPKELGAAARVCLLFNLLSKDWKIWKPLCEQQAGEPIIRSGHEPLNAPRNPNSTFSGAKLGPLQLAEIDWRAQYVVHELSRNFFRNSTSRTKSFEVHSKDHSVHTPSAVTSFCTASSSQKNSSGLFDLITGSADSTIGVWSLSKDFLNNQNLVDPIKLKTKLVGHMDQVTDLQIKDSKIYSAASDKTIKIWNIKSLQCTSTLKAHKKIVDRIHLLKNVENVLISASRDSTIKLWDLETENVLNTIDLDRVPNDVQLNTSQDSLVWCDTEGFNQLDLETQQITKKIPSSDTGSCLAVTSSQLAILGGKSLALLDLRTNEPFFRWDSGTDYFTNRYRPLTNLRADEAKILSLDVDRRLLVWDLRFLKDHRAFLGQDVTSFTLDGSRLWCGYLNGRLSVLEYF